MPVAKDVPPVATEYQLMVPADDVAPKLRVPVPQRLPPVVEDIAGNALIVKLLPLSVPINKGLLETTLILYAEPLGVLAGIVALILPFDVVLMVPIFVGDANEPEASDNWAVKTLSLLKDTVEV